ncbi:5-nitroimidazole antibiotic resistance protein [Clostridiales bacterium]|nr:5-nitroimidazole antibiotic resistance protein [Clostridiales bacterium]
MKREMYKKERQMSEADVIKACQSGNHGTLSMIGDDGYPYATPVNYIYIDGKIYIHSAKYGYKVDCVNRDNKVCFSAIINAKVEQSKFTAAFQSIIAKGKIHAVEDEGERRKVLEQFIYKLSPDFVENGMKFVDGAIGKTLLLCMDIEEMTGKENMATSFDA